MAVPVFNQTPNVQNRPMARKDAQGNLIPNSFEDLAFQGQYSGTNLIYKGFARPGALTSASVWQIAFMTYDGSGNLLTITWPQDVNGHASNDYQFIWDNRATYTYS
jgi:YD repeat-containing protein